MWDGGDCYTLASLGPLSAPRVVFGAVILEGHQAADAKVRIFLKRSADKPSRPAGHFQSPDGDWYTAEGQVDANGRMVTIPVRIVEVTRSLDERRAAFLESGLLKDTTVLVIGLGTGGAQVAVELAKSGVGSFILVDPDRLEVGNIGRHLAGISHVGRQKTHVMKDLLLEKNPTLLVESHPVALNLETLEEVRGRARRAELVICATDGRASKLLVNRLCVEERKPMIVGGAFRRAYGGQVFRVRPGQSPCYHCFVMAMPEKEADNEVSSEENAQEVAYSDHAVPVEPGLSIDVAPIALMVAKLALQELLEGKPSTLHVLDQDFSAPWYLWINRPEPKTEYAALPPLSESVEANTMTILRWYGVHLDRDTGCPTCGNFEDALREAYELRDPHLPAPQEGSLPPGISI
jgi:molybdopterin/thiamine biosynthesis adenylyltransferase